MIDRVTIERSTYADPLQRFEAGTPAIAETIALGAAIDYVSQIGMENIRAHEQDVLVYAHQRLAAVKGLRLVGRLLASLAWYHSPWIAHILIFRPLSIMMV